MPRSTTTALTLTALIGLALTGYVIVQLPPKLSGGQLNMIALIPLHTGLFLVATGGVGLLALGLSRRWPILAGRRALSRSKAMRLQRRAQAAVRQGVLAGMMTVLLLALSFTGRLDLTIAGVVIVLIGLVESFVQSRE